MAAPPPPPHLAPRPASCQTRRGESLKRPEQRPEAEKKKKLAEEASAEAGGHSGEATKNDEASTEAEQDVQVEEMAHLPPGLNNLEKAMKSDPRLARRPASARAENSGYFLP